MSLGVSIDSARNALRLSDTLKLLTISARPIMPPQQNSSRVPAKHRNRVGLRWVHSLALVLPSAPVPKGRFDMSETKPRVLIIDDDDEIRDILNELLSAVYDCTTCSSAANALAVLASDSFDVILSDINMPEMTGLEMIPYLANIAPMSVVVMISGQLMIESAIDAMRAGAFDYITKPFDLPQVKTVVSRAVDHGKRLQSPMLGGNLKDKAVERLEQALKDGAFVVHYQPQVDIQSNSVVGAEALVRWNDE